MSHLDMSSVPPELRGGPFTARTARAAGLTLRRLQSARYRKLHSGVHVAADVELTVPIRSAAIALVLPEGAVVGAATAALLHGADVRRLGDDMIDVVTARKDQVRRPGIRSRAALLEPGDVVRVGGLPVLSPTRVAFDLARQKDLIDGVVGIDAMLNRGGCVLDELSAYIDSHSGWRGIRYAREALRHAEPLSESPMESRQRMLIVLAGLPRPTAQVPVWEGEVLIASIDNGYEQWKVGADYDGEPHKERWRYDLERQERIHDQGWWHRRYTSLHMGAGSRQMVRQIGAALVAAGWRP